MQNDEARSFPRPVAEIFRNNQTINVQMSLKDMPAPHHFTSADAG
jgi:hypothetical protein